MSGLWLATTDLSYSGPFLLTETQATGLKIVHGD